ncbi:ImmA/IrrE family metallo-endopeptidase [[Clostridium] polysaccharolyticum]|uniref:IrrE N-terminal-like domain-containing protein n=1 Tax=[Clostridium] polysaccharolyticum TaxID=29364 RepID=A0A1I0DLC3_9FIRM|nr:ImmA/IrrE family metallo-endopeptidase [[Clostridium] polysaccharolyticum]SET33304.1 protein of unknown function [[Clostridium] polysaccharolyticum]
MNHTTIKQNILQLYQNCHIATFPVSCISILNQYNITCFSYKELTAKQPALSELCQKYSNDAFSYGNLVCYNDTMPIERIRFSLMHELGHLLLHSENETDANLFASHLLAPRCILKKSRLTQPKDISTLFGISREAAVYALKDLSKMDCSNTIDEQLLEHFYSPKLGIYVYHISECPVCGSTIYNSIHNTCLQCKKLSIKSR